MGNTPDHAKEQRIDKSFINHLRQTSRLSCPFCEDGFASDERMREHLTVKHPDGIAGKDIGALIRQIKGGRGSAVPAAESSSPRTRARSSSVPKRARIRQQNTNAHDPDFVPRSTQQGKLWDPEATSAPARKNPSSSQTSRTPALHKEDDLAQDENLVVLPLMKQPETRAISQEQLVAEVKGIYAGLMMVEAKCIEVDNAQSSQSDAKLNNKQWQALIALHRTLLHEHHDFFLASQHPSASPALKQLATKYAMPARMWRHAIHSFLELLRHSLPASFEYMLTFVYMAYSMLALLYETVPVFEETWIECLGDLGRYRMAIEDDDIRDRDVWTSVSRNWYSKASDKDPTVGRLYHHLAILARPNALQQLFYYSKSLCVPKPFASTKESIMTLFDPIFSKNGYQHGRLSTVDISFVKAHGVLFSQLHGEEFRPAVKDFLTSLNGHIDEIEKGWLEAGYHIAIANCCSILSYGQENNVLMQLIGDQSDDDQTMELEFNDKTPSIFFKEAINLAMETHNVVFARQDDNVLPYIHVVMTFMFHFARIPNAIRYLEPHFPWKLLSMKLNEMLESYKTHHRVLSDDFPREQDVPPHPLPEDFALKGLSFVSRYFPDDWFSNTKIDDDEKYLEMASMADVRKERILWLGYKITQCGSELTYDKSTGLFGVETA
ncbi:hypothetical protein GGS21DRAFT_506327 [Xylaria nigripes]|nr:hypothetical protein GGS21DRAFT_506327 [Xylaria nigripes]